MNVGKSILQFVKHLSYKSTALQILHKCSLTAKGQIKLLRNLSIYSTGESYTTIPKKYHTYAIPHYFLYLLFALAFLFVYTSVMPHAKRM